VLLSQFLGLACTVEEQDRLDWAITAADGRELRLPDVFLATAEEQWLAPASLPGRPLMRWHLEGTPLEATPLEPELPVVFGAPPWWRDEGERLWLGLDVFGSAFFLLTRYEEAVRPERDGHGRFPAEASLAAQEGFLDRPLVNEYAEVLWRALKRLWPGLERKQRRYRVLLTHDVDDPFCTAFRGGLAVLKSAAGDVVKRRAPALAWRRLRSAAAVARGKPECDICHTFDLIMSQSERRGWQSCFHFITDHTDAHMDGRYSIDHPWIRGLLRRIHERGHEIGLHPSYHSYQNPAQIRREFERLQGAMAEEGVQQAQIGGRHHYLRWEPATWAAWDAASLAWDSTLTFAGRAGFRCSTCYEYPAYDLTADRPLRLNERPLVVMEVTLLEYMGLNAAEAGAEMLRLAARCRRFGGDFTLLWHNDRLILPRWADLYRSVVEAL
jgi:hypothetical protein